MKTLQKQQDTLGPRAESRTAACAPVEFTPLAMEPSLAQAQLGHAAPRLGNRGAQAPGSAPRVLPLPYGPRPGQRHAGGGNWQQKRLKAE